MLRQAQHGGDCEDGDDRPPAPNPHAEPVEASLRAVHAVWAESDLNILTGGSNSTKAFRAFQHPWDAVHYTRIDIKNKTRTNMHILRSFALSRIDENEDLPFCPPEPSADEQPADEDPEFLANCRAEVVSMSGGPVVWEDQLVTHSPKWGLVWRADFWDPKIDKQGWPSRVTCWRRDSGEFGTTVSGCQHGKLALKG